MKRLMYVVLFLLCTLLLNACSFLEFGMTDRSNQDTEQTAPPLTPAPIVATTFSRGAWVATAYSIDFPSNPSADSNTLKHELDGLVNKASEMGIDALFFQVRPSADAFYKSGFFPWSKYLTGTQGKAPSNNFDPLSYIINLCHNNGIQLHAWINPFRITASETDTLVSSHPAALIPWITINVDGKLYFNPGEFVARDIILNGIKEIIENYDVDGIHFDDYFYPEGITDQDNFTFEGRWSGPDNINDWRRWNIDNFLYQTKQLISETAPHVVFGISPSGIWANKTSNALGSDTHGFESYSAIYADSRGWVKNGIIDYIVPQIYWHIGQTNSDFTTVLNWWHEVCKDTEVSLYAGLAGYKVTDGTFKQGAEEIINQTELADQYTNGVVVFSLKDL